MSIKARNNSEKRELIPQGNYVARCYSQIEIGTVQEDYMGKPKIQTKVRIGWELPTELRVFKEENGEQPLVISNEYTLSMGEKANLRKILESWRGKAFTEDEAKEFDITKLVGKPCMLNVIHKVSGENTYANIGSIAPIPKGLECPPQINKTFVLSYDEFDKEKFETLPDFIKTKMQGSLEYQAIMNPQHTGTGTDEPPEDFFNPNDESENLPF